MPAKNCTLRRTSPLHAASLSRIHAGPAQIKYLEAQLSFNGYLVSWGANDLCNRGSRKSLPGIRGALATVLKLKPEPNVDLLRWAIGQLAATHSAVAYARLVRFYTSTWQIPESERTSAMFAAQDAIPYATPGPFQRMRN